MLETQKEIVRLIRLMLQWTGDYDKYLYKARDASIRSRKNLLRAIAPPEKDIPNSKYYSRIALHTIQDAVAMRNLSIFFRDQMKMEPLANIIESLSKDLYRRAIKTREESIVNRYQEVAKLYQANFDKQNG